MRNNLDKCVRIPMIPNLRSLNLSNSVAIAVYEVLRQHSFSMLEDKGKLFEEYIELSEKGILYRD